MELTLRPRQKTDYKLLNEGESLSIRKTLQNSTPVVLDGTFNVERLIHRKKEKGSHEQKYLVKWEGYHASDCTWEPESHLPAVVVNNYIPTEVDAQRLKAVSDAFERTIQSRLKSKNPRSVIDMDFDIFRYLFGEKAKLCELRDFEFLNLPDNWYYRLNNDGSGRKIKFPVRLSIRLCMRKIYVKENQKLTEKTIPVERCIINSCTEACCVSDL